MGGRQVGPPVRPAREAGVAPIEVDPVCGALLAPGPGLRCHLHQGKTFHFCSSRCQRAFVARPQDFVRSREASGPVGYACPMHPRRLSRSSGTCPICGLILEPQASAEEAERQRTLADLRTRFWSSVALTGPLLLVALLDSLAGRPLALLIPRHVANWFELLLATPVVLLCGRRLFERAWQGVRVGRPDRFLPLALGAGIAWASSALATLAPRVVPPWALAGAVEAGLHFRAAALVVTVALLSELLELRVIGQKRLAKPARRARPRFAQGASRKLERQAALEITSRRVASLIVVAGLGAAAGSFAWWAAGAGAPAFECALAVLIVASPWAFVLSAPASLALATQRAARGGLRIERAEALEALGRAHLLVLGGESVLVDRNPRLIAVAAAPGFDERELLRLAIAAARGLGSDLEAPLVEGARERGIEEGSILPAARRRGARALVQGRAVRFAGLERLKQLGLDPGALGPIAEDCRRAGGVPTFVLINERLGGVLALSGRLSSGSRRALAELRASGLRVVLLTRERAESTRARARRLGVDEVRVAAPDRRAALLAHLQKRGRLVALAACAGEPADALEQADVALVTGRGAPGSVATVVLEAGGVREIVRARRLAASAVGNIRQNLRLAAGFMLVAAPLAAGLLYPWTGFALRPEAAGAGLGASVLLVVANAWRLKHARL